MIVSTCATCLAEGRPPQAQQSDSKSSSGTGRKTPENSDSYFDHPWPEWFDMRCRHHAHCQSGREAGEDDLRRAVGRDRRDHREGSRQSALPIAKSPRLHREQGLRGDEPRHSALVDVMMTPLSCLAGAFFRLAADLGVLPEVDAPPVGEDWLGMTSPQREFWEGQVDAPYRFYEAPTTGSVNLRRDS